MSYLRIALCGLNSVFLAEFLPWLWRLFHNGNYEKATGFAVLAAGFLESLVSPVFWALGILFFLLFLRMSKLDNRAVRVLLFWIPTAFLSSIALLFVGTCAYLFFRYAQH